MTMKCSTMMWCGLAVSLQLFAMGCEPENKKQKTTETSAQAGEGAETGSKPAAGEKPIVVVTTTMLATAAAEIGGDAVDVRSIMKPGGDPHLYQPRPSDAKMVTESALVITSGLHLEGWVDDLVRNAGGERPVVVASDGVEPIKMEGSPGGVDPHFWFDLQEWSKASQNITRGMVDLVGAESDAGKDIAKRGAAYKAKIDALHGWTGERLATIPEEQRILITSHDAFNYFGRAYSIDVVGIQGVSTEQEASQRDVANIIETVKKRKTPAIFVESSVNPALIKQVASETGSKAAGPLFSDSVGTEGSGAETFVTMFVKNVEEITVNLGGKYEAFSAPDAKESGK